MAVFKKHTMYNKSGKSKTANTNKEHLSLKKKGWVHIKPKAGRVESLCKVHGLMQHD